MGNSSSQSRAPAPEKLEVEVASPSCKRVASKSAGYACVINATVREGRVWLPKQHHRLESPRNRGVGTPRVCRPADYLPPGTVGQWPPATGQWWNERSGGDPKTVRATQGTATQKPTSVRRNSRSNLGARGGDPRTLASWRHLFSASCRGNFLHYSDKFQADTLRDGMSLIGFRNLSSGPFITVRVTYAVLRSRRAPRQLYGYGYSFSWSSSTGSSCTKQTPLVSSEVEGRWQWPSLVAILFTAQLVRSG